MKRGAFVACLALVLGLLSGQPVAAQGGSGSGGNAPPAPTSSTVTANITVAKDFVNMGDIKVVFYAATASGGRGQLLANFRTQPALPTSIAFLADNSIHCFVVDFTAPSGETFQPQGTRTITVPNCDGNAPGPDRFGMIFDFKLASTPATQVAVDLRGGPRLISGSTVGGRGTDYVLTGRPGELASLEAKSIDGDTNCANVPGSLLLLTSTDQSQVYPFVACLNLGPITIPADGRVVVKARTGSFTRPTRYQIRMAEFTIATVPVDLTQGPVEVSERIDVADDGTDYILHGTPHTWVSVTQSATACLDHQLTTQVGQVFDDAGLVLSPTPDCGHPSVWRFPDSGSLTLTARHGFGELADNPAGRTYRISLQPFDYADVPLPLTAPDYTAEVSGSITMPLGGTDYILTAPGTNTLTVDVLGLDADQGCPTVPGPALVAEFWNLAENALLGNQFITECGGPLYLGTLSLDEPVILRIRTTDADPDRPLTATYHLRFNASLQ